MCQHKTKRIQKSLKRKDRFPKDGPFDKKNRTVPKHIRCPNAVDMLGSEGDAITRALVFTKKSL